MTFWCGSGSDSFFHCFVFKESKKEIFFIFFYNLPIQSKTLNFLLKFCLKILFCRQYFSPLITCMWIGKDPEQDPYLWIMDPNPDSGGPKTCESGSVSGSPILVFLNYKRYQEIDSFSPHGSISRNQKFSERRGNREVDSSICNSKTVVRH